MKYALVSLNVPLRNSTYTYSYDEGEMPDILYKRVSVSFGARNMTGFVVALQDEKPEGDFEIKPIVKVQDKERVINEELVELAHKMSVLYKCSSGQALSLMVPNAKREVDYAPFSRETSFRRIEKLTDDQQRVLDKYHQKRIEGVRSFYLYELQGLARAKCIFALQRKPLPWESRYSTSFLK